MCARTGPPKPERCLDASFVVTGGTDAASDSEVWLMTIIGFLGLEWVRCFTSWPVSWWRHQMETFSALLAICAGNLPVPGEFPAQRPVARSFHVFFDLRLNKPLSKQSRGWWFETLSRLLWCHCNVQGQTKVQEPKWGPENVWKYKVLWLILKL